jgi:Zn-dependent protease
MHEPDQDGLMMPPIGDGDAPVEGQVVADAQVDEFEKLVLAELEKIRNPKTNWFQTIVILLVSLALFIGLGMLNNPIAFTVMLIAVLFLHELGHYMGMRIFGYRNVRMFFIPLFGAAVSGQKTDAKSYQEAIVTLLGPMPGLFVAAILFGLACVPGIDHDFRRYLIWASLLFGMINGFNLLPIFPLDGGRLLNLILFSRNRFLESGFLVLAALALLSYGAAKDYKIFLFLGGWLIISLGPTFKMNTIAQDIGGQFRNQLPSMNDPIPMQIFRAIIGQVKDRFPAAKTPKGMAGMVFRVWERMHVRPPGALATVILLFVYALAVLLTIPWLLPFFITIPKR